MAQGKQKWYFAQKGDNGGSLDAENSTFVIGENSWINAENFRAGSTDKGFTGLLESIGGTRRISTPSPSVSFLEIGATADIVGRRIIYAYYNTTTSQHKIEVYDFVTDTTLLALLSSQVTGGLNFSKDYLIDGQVINGIWYFNDNLNPPRKLNIDAAIKMNNPTYSTSQAAYTTPLELDVITLIRKPPAFALQNSKQTLGGVTVNNIADFSGQFAWFYYFRDGEKSVPSPISQRINYNTDTETLLGVNSVVVVATDGTGTITEHISQDVQVVNFCVRYGNNPQLFIIRSWDRRITADAAAIAAHNAGITPLTFTFLNDITGIACDAAFSVKPYDSVPRLSKTLSSGLDRIMLGGNYESFNTPIATSLTAILHSTTNHTPFQNPSFHTASPYQVGIIFRDRYKRIIGNVVTLDALRIQVPEVDYNITTYYDFITWGLSNAAATSEIPDTAYYYEIVLTKNLRTRFFAQAKSGGMKYAIKDPTTSVISYQDTYVSNAYGLAFDASLLNAAGMGYSFDPLSGDIIKVYQAASATRYSLAVIAQDAAYIISTLQDLGGFAVQPDIRFEIYTPYKPSVSEPYFTVGQTYIVNNPTTNSRTYATIAGTLIGDVYLFGRAAPSGSYTAENMSPQVKYWKEWNVNAGELNLVLNSVAVRKQTAVRWSNVIIEGSQTNGLSTFDALDEKILPFDIGNLQKLQNTSKVQEQGNIMLAIGDQETASCYLGEVQLVASSQNAYLASAPSVIGTVNVLRGNFGTLNPESVVEYRGDVFWLDLNNGRYIQYSTNGLFPISNYKMKRFWNLWCQQFLSMTAAQIEALGGRPFVFSTVDPFHDELLISLPKLMEDPPKGYLPTFQNPHATVNVIYPFDILDFQGKTVVYDLVSNTWRGAYTFYREGFATLENNLYGFRNGQMYLHNQYNNQCNFDGIQYKARIMPIANYGPNIPKIFNNIAIEGNIQPTYVYLYCDYPYQQISDLVDYQFTPLEGVWNSVIYRNLIQPTAIGNTTDSRLTGEKMRNVAMYIMLEFSPTGSNPTQLKFLNLTFTLSIGNPNTVPER